jgi:putative oxidoreductase
MTRQTINNICAGLLIILFVYTGIFKILTPGIMEMDLSKPEQPEIVKKLSTILAYGIPLLELLIALLLLFPKYRRIGFLSAFFLMLIFTGYVVYILYNYSKGIQRPCTCGGIFRKLSWENHLIVNILFVCTALIGFFYSGKNLNDAERLQAVILEQ